MKRRLKTILIAAVAGAGAISQANFLNNGDFSAIGPNGNPVTATNLYPGPCAADQWEAFLNYPGTLTTEIGGVPAELQGATRAIHFQSDCQNSEIAQLFTSPDNAVKELDCWVYVVRGNAFMGAGDGGATGPMVGTDLKRQWVHLDAFQPGKANEAIIGTYGLTDGADFYVANARVAATPEPVSIGAMAVGLGSMLLRRRRSRKQTY